MVADGEVRLRGKLRDTARFALENPDMMATGTTRAIARRVGTSSTTVWKLAGACGFGEYRDFRCLFQRYILAKRDAMLGDSER